MNTPNHLYYLPAAVTVGLFGSKSGGKSGFVTCKYMDRGWLKAATFERLTDGYGPSQSKDPETQLRKIVHNKVMSFPNDPTEGFRVTGRTFNIYGYKTGEYNRSAGDIIVLDPRGFEIGIPPKDFAEIIAGADIMNGVIAGKYAYAWSTDSSHCMTLLKEGTSKFKDADACRTEFEGRERPKIECVKKGDLAVGHAYGAMKVLTGDWIYAGIHDTYSDECHVAAFDSGKYDIKAALENEKDWASSGYYAKLKTSTGRMVFFPAKFDMKRPWVSRADISGVFKNEVPLPSAFHFFDSPPKGVPTTVESIETAIAANPAFQRIDFARFGAEKDWESLDFEVFSCMIEQGERPAKFMAFPFDRYYYAIFKASANSPGYGYLGKYQDCWLRISSDSYTYSRCGSASDWRVVNLTLSMSNRSMTSYYPRLDPDRYRRMTHEQLYSLVSPVVPKLYFENGNKVPQHIAALFIPSDIRDINSRC